MFEIIPSAFAEGPAAPPADAGMMQIVFLIAIFAIFYFITIRPQRKRQKEHQQLLNDLQAGDEVVTTAGVLGKVRKVEEEFVVLKVADNVELKFQKQAVHAVMPKGTIKSIDA